MHNEQERRELARLHLDAVEIWLRRIINHQLTKAFGHDYWKAKFSADQQTIIPARVRDRVMKRQTAEPSRFKRPLDAITFDDAIDLVLHPRLFPEHFRQALSAAFPNGSVEARTYLSRLKSHRDQLAHGGICSQRCLEQCICYSNDVTDSLKAHFQELKMEQIFNVPRFIRVIDNKGNDFSFNTENEQGQFVDFRTRGKGDLYIGERLIIEVEVDESFSDFIIEWLSFNGDCGSGKVASIAIEPKHVGVQMDVRFQLKSNETWHRLLGGIDDMLDIRYRVFPPT